MLAFSFGPAIDEGISSLNIYPVNYSRVNNNISSGTYDLESGSNIDAIGFPALDLLLFQNDEAGTLSNLSDANYVQYIEDLVNQIHTKAKNVNDSWKNSYKATFINANGTDAGSSISLLTNSFILSFEKDAREGKIGIPAGVRTLNQAIPSKVEGFYSGISIALAKEHMTTLKEIYEGKGGESFKSILENLDKKDLAKNISTQFEKIESSLNSLTDPFSEMLTISNSEALSTYGEYQKLLPLLKVDMTSDLSLLITYSNSDGD